MSLPEAVDLLTRLAGWRQGTSGLIDLLGRMKQRNKFTSPYCGGKPIDFLVDGGKERVYHAILWRRTC
jgi:hypothetical protein